MTPESRSQFAGALIAFALAAAVVHAQNTISTNSKITGQGTGLPGSVTVPGIGTTSTDGVRLVNPTPAAAGAQQFSPRTCWEGQGWRTNATAESQSVVFCAETQPVQGTSAPTGNWILKASINGGAFSTVGTFSSAGALTMPTATFSTHLVSPRVYIGANTSSPLFINVSDGVADFSNSAETNKFRTSVDDAKTTLSAEAVSVANGTTLFLGTSMLGQLIVTASGDGASGQYGVGGTSAQEHYDFGGVFTATKDTAGNINVYHDAAGASGAGFYLQNNRSTQSFRVVLIGS